MTFLHSFGKAKPDRVRGAYPTTQSAGSDQGKIITKSWRFPELSLD